MKSFSVAFHKTSILLFLLFITINLSAQNRRNTGQNMRMGNSIEGTVIDATAKVPLEYSNIVLFNQEDSTQVDGTVTNELGIFKFSKVRKGSYYLKISFIGYTSKIVDEIEIIRKTKLDVGEILLEAESFNTNDVIVTGERAPITYKLDKKIINVDEMITTASGSAVDILENVPSITVDVEGNVSLRGSSNFTVLIDGRQSILEGSEALEQIPASSIDNLEIITNPSAKYNPEGTAGIINVIIKKNSLNGMSGVTSLNVGLNDKYGGELLLGYRGTGYTASVGLDYNNRNFEMETNTENWTSINGTKYYNNSDGLFIRERTPYGIKGMFAFDLSKNDLLTLNAKYGYRDGGRNSMLNHDQWNSTDTDVLSYTSTNDRSRGGDYYSMGIAFDHKFNGQGHEIKSDLSYRKRNSDNLTLYEQFDESSVVIDGQRSTESEPSTSIDLKIDYVLPFNEDSKFEAGYRADFNSSESVNDYFLYNPTSSNYEYADVYSTETIYDNNIHALYSMYSNKISDLEFQVGLRTEYTDRQIELTNTSESFTIDRFDYFPSAHISYNLGSGNQFMTSYARRIDRPRGWQLEPFIVWIDPYNVRQGNPALEPEYIDSYEMGFQKLFKKSILSAELYYRVINNKSEYIQRAYEENVTLRTVENVGKDFSFGTELMFNFDPLQFWNVNLMGNLYNYKLEGDLDGRNFDKESFNWNSRFNNKFKITPTTQFQLNGFYNSPTVTAQGERKGYFMANVALKQELFNKKLAVTLQVRDLLGTAKREYISESFDFYRHSEYMPESPMVMLNLRFNINNYKIKDRSNGERGSNGDDDEF